MARARPAKATTPATALLANAVGMEAGLEVDEDEDWVEEELRVEVLTLNEAPETVDEAVDVEVEAREVVAALVALPVACVLVLADKGLGSWGRGRTGRRSSTG